MKDGKHVILCVDDDDDVLFTLRVILESAQYIMVGARTAEEGVRRYREHRPDFVLVDLMMEESDSGASFARELKALGNRAPVYMLSTVGDQLSGSVDPAQLGLDGVFQKPINAETLLLTLKTKLKG